MIVRGGGKWEEKLFLTKKGKTWLWLVIFIRRFWYRINIFLNSPSIHENVLSLSLPLSLYSLFLLVSQVHLAEPVSDRGRSFPVQGSPPHQPCFRLAYNFTALRNLDKGREKEIELFILLPLKVAGWTLSIDNAITER